jgi:hypothetical protein
MVHSITPCCRAVAKHLILPLGVAKSSQTGPWLQKPTSRCGVCTGAGLLPPVAVVPGGGCDAGGGREAGGADVAALPPPEHPTSAAANRQLSKVTLHGGQGGVIHPPYSPGRLSAGTLRAQKPYRSSRQGSPSLW